MVCLRGLLPRRVWFSRRGEEFQVPFVRHGKAALRPLLIPEGTIDRSPLSFTSGH